LHGAHVTHFQPRGRGPVLFLSGKSAFAPGKPIRGGVPIIFPWFGPRAGDPANLHGFVRTRPWNVSEVRQAGDTVRASFALASDEQTRAIWPHDFELRFSATFGPSLEMELEVKNTSGQPIQFEEALHTYLAVGDVRAATIDGLAGTPF